MISRFFALSALATTLAQPTTPPRPPNIVVILADDLGWTDLGCYGEKRISTPHIDALATQGMRFTNAYASASVCSPTRAALLTGKAPARLHITDWIPGRSIVGTMREPEWTRELPESEVTIAELLHSAGYATAIIGKWHLGDYRQQTKQGFDVVHGANATAQRGDPSSWFSPYGDPTLPDGPPGEYLTDRLTAEALAFIGANQQRPFFLYLAHNSPHLPLAAKASDLEKYAGRAAELRPKSPVYAAMIDSLDQSVGRIMATLRALHLDENTLVVFASDNGGFLGFGHDGNPEHPPTVTTNAPLRGGKRTLYEGGIRVPLIARFPGRIAPGTASDALTDSSDWFPTFGELAGISAEKLPAALDGRSLLPVLRGERTAHRTQLGWHYPHYQLYDLPPGGAWRSGPWKLVMFYNGRASELYNLKTDPGESRDLAAEQPDQLRQLETEFKAWLAHVGAQMPTRAEKP